MKSVLSVFGTRPEVIKMAPVVHALSACDEIKSMVCTTSQHRAMQDQMMEVFHLKPDVDLDVMIKKQDLFHITTEVLIRLKKILLDLSPEMVLVHGDTTTSFAAAQAAFYLGIPVGHVEAGLRTYDLQAPFPEECNRQLTDRLSSFMFAPTQQAHTNLLQERLPRENISITGNTVIDALFWIKDRLNLSKIENLLPENVMKLATDSKPYILITGHRRENFGEGFINICKAISKLANQYPEWHFVYPVHFNPNVVDPVHKLLGNHSNVHLIDPVDYEPFVFLMKHCQIVLTDSGGVQEEAPSLGKPVLVMRDVTERPEGIKAGTAKLVGTNKDSIVFEVSRLITNQVAYNKMANAVNPYGDGKAADRIVSHIKHYFGLSNHPVSSLSRFFV